MKTLFYVILLLIVLAAFGAGIYYLVMHVDFGGISEKASSAADWISEKAGYIKNLFS